mmetsp:Transcript_5370/g.8483  ORF Transcript_5370/g.8483 Transcript_5370/m.8483 type:complete len:364 (-) Transcript_5370:53-1144(-)
MIRYLHNNKRRKTNDDHGEGEQFYRHHDHGELSDHDSLFDYSLADDSVNSADTEAYYELKELFSSHDWKCNSNLHSRALRLLQSHPSLIQEEYDEFDWNEGTEMPPLRAFLYAGISSRFSAPLRWEDSICYTPIFEFLKAKNTLSEIQGIVDVQPEILTEHSNLEPLPLHYACGLPDVLNHNEGLVEFLAQAYPSAISIPYDHKLPIHILLENHDCPPLETVKLLVDMYPDSSFLPVHSVFRRNHYDNLIHFALAHRLRNPNVLLYLIDKLSLPRSHSSRLTRFINLNLVKHNVTSFLPTIDTMALLLSGTLAEDGSETANHFLVEKILLGTANHRDVLDTIALMLKTFLQQRQDASRLKGTA